MLWSVRHIRKHFSGFYFRTVLNLEILMLGFESDLKEDWEQGYQSIEKKLDQATPGSKWMSSLPFWGTPRDHFNERQPS